MRQLSRVVSEEAGGGVAHGGGEGISEVSEQVAGGDGFEAEEGGGGGMLGPVFVVVLGGEGGGEEDGASSWRPGFEEAEASSGGAGGLPGAEVVGDGRIGVVEGDRTVGLEAEGSGIELADGGLLVGGVGPRLEEFGDGDPDGASSEGDGVRVGEGVAGGPGGGEVGEVGDGAADEAAWGWRAGGEVGDGVGFEAVDPVLVGGGVGNEPGRRSVVGLEDGGGGEEAAGWIVGGEVGCVGRIRGEAVAVEDGVAGVGVGGEGASTVRWVPWGWCSSRWSAAGMRSIFARRFPCSTVSKGKRRAGRAASSVS